MTSTTWTYKVKQGGLMRCCVQSLDRQMLDRLLAGSGPPTEGMTVQCEYAPEDELHRMTLHDGAFEWDRPKP